MPHHHAVTLVVSWHLREGLQNGREGGIERREGRREDRRGGRERAREKREGRRERQTIQKNRRESLQAAAIHKVWKSSM